MTDVKRATDKVGNNDALEHVIRGGLVAYGVIHILIGWLAIQIALGEKSKQASGTGALEYLAQQPLGGVLIWVVSIGMLALVVWRLLEAWEAYRIQDGADRVKGMVSQLFKGVVYAVLAFSAIRVALGQSGSGGGTDSMTADLMKMTAGQLLVGAVGLGVLGYGLYYVYQGWTEKFLKKLDGLPQRAETSKAYRWLGKAGFIAKGIAIALIGGLFVYAAVTHEPKQSAGLDQALQEIARQPFGQVLLTLVAVGIACYGLFAFARARHLSR
jgi:Domain of Unknown Function (DUF1206)